jgi:hypothetical protein
MKMSRGFSFWLTRLILAWPTLVFALISSRYLLHPAQSASAQGIALASPLGLTILRVGFGAFPLACFFFTLFCLISEHRILTGLTFVSTVMSAALVVRVFGMLADGTTRQNMRLVVAELVMLVLLSIGVVLEMGRQRRLQEQPA